MYDKSALMTDKQYIGIPDIRELQILRKTGNIMSYTKYSLSRLHLSSIMTTTTMMKPSDTSHRETSSALISTQVAYNNPYHCKLDNNGPDNTPQWYCSPSAVPSLEPTIVSSPSPTTAAVITGPPTKVPTKAPTDEPTRSPTKSPSGAPTGSPTKYLTSEPTRAPTKVPTKSPTGAPTGKSTPLPTNGSNNIPSVSPTHGHHTNPNHSSPPSLSSASSSADSNDVLTDMPTASPTYAPTVESCPNHDDADINDSNQRLMLSFDYQLDIEQDGGVDVSDVNYMNNLIGRIEQSIVQLIHDDLLQCDNVNRRERKNRRSLEDEYRMVKLDSAPVDVPAGAQEQCQSLSDETTCQLISGEMTMTLERNGGNDNNLDVGDVANNAYTELRNVMDGRHIVSALNNDFPELIRIKYLSPDVLDNSSDGENKAVSEGDTSASSNENSFLEDDAIRWGASIGIALIVLAMVVTLVVMRKKRARRHEKAHGNGELDSFSDDSRTHLSSPRSQAGVVSKRSFSSRQASVRSDLHNGDDDESIMVHKGVSSIDAFDLPTWFHHNLDDVQDESVNDFSAQSVVSSVWDMESIASPKTAGLDYDSHCMVFSDDDGDTTKLFDDNQIV